MPNRGVRYTAQFKSDLKRANAHKKCDVNALRSAMTDLQMRTALLPALLDHALRGRYPNQRGGKTDCRECHTGNDWLLVYRLPDDDTIIFIRTGTHSDLF